MAADPSRTQDVRVSFGFTLADLALEAEHLHDQFRQFTGRARATGGPAGRNILSRLQIVDQCMHAIRRELEQRSYTSAGGDQ